LVVGSSPTSSTTQLRATGETTGLANDPRAANSTLRGSPSEFLAVDVALPGRDPLLPITTRQLYRVVCDTPDQRRVDVYCRVRGYERATSASKQTADAQVSTLAKDRQDVVL